MNLHWKSGMERRRKGRPISFFFGFPIVWLFAVAISASAQQGKSSTKPAPPAPQIKEDPLAPLLRQATNAIDKMDFDAALDPLQEYIAQRPDDAYAHFQLGYAYAGLKRAQNARAEFSRAITLDPKMSAAQLNLGLVLMDADPTAAAEAFRHASELSPSESRPRFLEGVALEHAGNLTGALERYRAALTLDPTGYEIQFALGRALLRTKDAAGAEVQFRGAIAARADSAPARLGLADALLEQKKLEAASDAFAEYLKLNPGDRAAHFNRASALFDLSRYEDALAEIDLAESGATPTPETLKMRGEIFMQQKKWQEARDTLTQALKISGTDPEPAYWLGKVDIELHDYPAAVGILDQVYKQNPQSVEVLHDLANALFLHEDYSAALAAMDRLAKLEPPMPGSWFVRAICYDKLSLKAEAMDAYQKFLDEDGGQHDTQDFQARHRILALQAELGQSSKKSKK